MCRRVASETTGPSVIAAASGRPSPPSVTYTPSRSQRSADPQDRVVRIGVDDPVVALAGRACSRSSCSRGRGRRRATGRSPSWPCCRRRSPRHRAPSRSGPRTGRRCPTRRRSGPCRRDPGGGRRGAGGPGRRGSAECGSVAASSNDIVSGIVAKARSGAQAYSAKAPWPNGYRSAKTRSPGANRVTPGTDRVHDTGDVEPKAVVARRTQSRGTAGRTPAAAGCRRSRHG